MKRYALYAQGDNYELTFLGEREFPQEWSYLRVSVALLDELWDSRLDSASCRPVFTELDEEDEQDETA